MPTEIDFGYFTREEALQALGIPDASDPKLAALAATSWGGNALKVLQVNATENGWQFAAITGVTDGDKGDITVSASGATWTIDNDVVSNATLANMAQATIKGRADAAGTGDPTDLTAAQVLTILGGTTGTGTLVREGSPTLTGTLTAATAIFSGGLTANAGITASNVSIVGASPAMSLQDNDTAGNAALGVFNGRDSTNAVQWRVGRPFTTVLRFENLGGSFGWYNALGSGQMMLLDANGLAISGAVKPSSYTVAGVPSASTAGAGAMIYVSNESGGAVPAFSDGTNWRRVTDRAVIS